MSIAVLSHLAEKPGLSFTPISFVCNLNTKTLHQILAELQAKDFVYSRPIPPPSQQAKYNRKRPIRKHRLKTRTVVKRSYELTERGKQVLFWWERFVRVYEREDEKAITPFQQ